MSDVPNEKPIPPPPEIAENIDALAEVKIPTTVSDGIYKNLVSQIEGVLFPVQSAGVACSGRQDLCRESVEWSHCRITFGRGSSFRVAENCCGQGEFHRQGALREAEGDSC